jgi:CHAT domain-containing protein/tetratricopeptide (TPR) repeat protein
VSRALLALLVLSLMTASIPGDTLEDGAVRQLDDRIHALRVAADYAAAAAAARGRLDLIRADERLPEYELADAARLAEDLERIAELPRAAQLELATADSMVGPLAALWDEGRYAEGREVAERQLELRREHLGDVHADVSESLNELALFLWAAGDYAAAVPPFEEALEIDRQILGEGHPRVATSLGNLATALHYAGDVGSAEPLLREALGLQITILGEEDAEVANTMGNLALVLHEQGRTDEAAHLFRRSLAIRRAIFPEGHPDIELSLHNLAGALSRQGALTRAEALSREALAMSRAMRGDDHPDVANGKSSLATVLNAQGQYDEAEELLREALDTLERRYGASHPDVLLVSNNLAEVVAAGGDLEQGIRLLRESLEIDADGNAQQDLVRARTMSNLSVLLARRGDFREAAALAREALAIRRPLLSSSNPDLVLSLHNLGTHEWRLGNAARAESLLALAAGAYEDARLRVGRGLARSMFLPASPYSFLAASRLDLGRDREAWEAAERGLARSLADMLMSADLCSLSGAEAARKDSLVATVGRLDDEIQACRVALLADSTDVLAEHYRRLRTQLVEAEVELGDLTGHSSQGYDPSKGEIFSLERVGNSLPDSAAILGWVDVWRQEGSYSSWGYVIRSPGDITWAPLEQPPRAERASAHARLRSYSRALSTPVSAPSGVLLDSRDVWRWRIEPLLGALGGVKDLWVIPSGAMLGVPVEALIDDEDTPLVERYRVSYAPSATVHTWLTEGDGVPRDNVPSRALLVGDPPHNVDQYRDMEGGTAGVHSEGAVVIAAIETDRQVLRSALAGDAEALSSLPRLTGSRREIADLSELCRESTVLLGASASEERLSDLAGSGRLRTYDLIHLATHALVDCAQPERSALVVSQVDLADPVESITRGERYYDGLVTAQEIAGEWQLGADLVTLSGCDTGLGREVEGEGYVGFAHAFLQAGARSLLLSLWKVDDDATAMLMRRFYENWLGDHGPADGGDRMARSEALRQAKLWLRDYADEQGRRPYAHPYYWSGFVLVS